jgi:predicted small secreted protein
MRSANVKRVATGILVALTALSLTACNTIRGVGQDLERAGETVQDSTD